mgnify:CR=1 FL=1
MVDMKNWVWCEDCLDWKDAGDRQRRPIQRREHPDRGRTAVVHQRRGRAGRRSQVPRQRDDEAPNAVYVSDQRASAVEGR